MELGEERRYKTGDFYMLKSVLVLIGTTVFLAESFQGDQCEWMVEGRRGLAKRQVTVDCCTFFCISLFTSLCGAVISSMLC